MKKYFYLLFFIVSFVSCANDFEVESYSDEYVNYGMSISIPTVNYVEENYMTKGYSKGSDKNSTMLAAIKIVDLIYDASINYTQPTYYAYAFFDNYEKFINFNVKLQKNHKYEILVDYLPNGKDFIYFVNDQGLYELPYQSMRKSEYDWNNFIYTDDDWIDVGGGLLSVDRHDQSTNHHYMHKYDRFGTPQAITIEPENYDNNINIELERMNWGLKFNFNKVDGYNYSDIIVDISDNWVYNVDLSKDETLDIPLMTWSTDYNTNEEQKLYLKIGTSNNKSEIFSGYIVIKRNKIVTYDVNLINQEDNKSMNLTISNTTMDNEDNGFIN